MAYKLMDWKRRQKIERQNTKAHKEHARKKALARGNSMAALKRKLAGSYGGQPLNISAAGYIPRGMTYGRLMIKQSVKKAVNIIKEQPIYKDII